MISATVRTEGKRGPRPGQGGRPGRFAEATKVARIPASWSVGEIQAAFEEIVLALEYVEDEIRLSEERSAATGLSNRWQHTKKFAEEIRSCLPKGFSVADSQ